MKILWLSGCYSQGVESALIVNAAFDIIFKLAHVARVFSVFWIDTSTFAERMGFTLSLIIDDTRDGHRCFAAPENCC